MFASKDKTHYICYGFTDDFSNIRLQINHSYWQNYSYAYFDYNPAKNPVIASQSIEDSILINGAYYKDVVILTANDFLDKIYVAKDMGVIMFTKKNSDLVWTINKPVN